MKVGIIGSGIVGRVLGAAFLKEGHDVMLGTRDAQKDEVVKWKSENAKAQIGSFTETTKFGDVVVLAVGGNIVQDAVKLAGEENFKNKVVIDACNPIGGAPVNGVLPFFTDINYSLMERIQKQIPEAKLVKAFSCVGNAFMYKPNFPGGKPTMFIAGNDDEAKKIVTSILDSFGWETEDMGKAEGARAIEPLCMLWLIPGFTRNQWNHAFKLLKM